MPSLLETLTARERAVRREWLENAVRRKARGACDSCGRQTEVARQARRRVFECVVCFEFGPDGASAPPAATPSFPTVEVTAP